MPREGEPGTLTAMLEQNAVPEARRLRRKTLPPSEDSDEESKREEREPLDPEEEARLDALDSEEFLRPGWTGPPLGPIPPPSRASSASGASGVSDTEVGVSATSALAKKIASHVNYHRTDQFINEAMAMHKAANRDEKHKLLQQFAADKSCKWVVQVQESHRSEKTSSCKSTDGWMTEWEIAELNKLPLNHPNYRRLIDAKLAGLPSMEHPVEEWRSDTELYEYHHRGPMEVRHSDTERQVVESQADMTKSKVVTIEVKKENRPAKLLLNEVRQLHAYEKKSTRCCKPAEQWLPN
jgi:hypothetical protein